MMLVPKRNFDIFDDLFNDPFFNSTESKLMKTDIKEHDDKYEILVDLPGFNKEDIKMHIDDGYLIINAKTNSEQSEKDKKGKYVRKERYYGECSRSFYVGNQINEEDINITKDYDISKKDDSLIIDGCDEKIEFIDNSIEYKEYSENRFSKSTYELIDEGIKRSMEYGTYVHSILEMDDLKNPTSEEVKTLKSLLPDLSDAEIFKEYEFIYKDNNEQKHGIIDLMIEYSDNIQIIDYKLSNIDDENYLKQLNGYKKYIESISDKPVSIYLYSINKNELRKL